MTLHQRNITATCRFPKTESDAEETLAQLKAELIGDGNAKKNLATFCQTYESAEVKELMDLSISKNMIDRDEYPETAKIEECCIHMIADLWNAPDAGNPAGTSTVGSSEACMLGGLAMYWKWRERRQLAGLDWSKPNLVSGPVQVCWEKFCRYWDIELRQTPMEDGLYAATPEQLLGLLDENTIGVVATFGLTFTGQYEPIEAICDALDQYESRTGRNLQVHVDAASGGFLAPFCAEEIRWDFQNPRVLSISASGHKFGLAPLGCGWILWRSHDDLPERLIFHVNYLGGDEEVFQLNFSRPAGPVISQYFEFLRLGYEGYRRIQMHSYEVAQWLSKKIKATCYFEMLSEGDPLEGIPALSWRLSKESSAAFNLYDLSVELRKKGWQVPSYTLPANAQAIVVQRILVRQDFTMSMARLFMKDLHEALNCLEASHIKAPATQETAGGFNHAG